MSRHKIRQSTHEDLHVNKSIVDRDFHGVHTWPDNAEIITVDLSADVSTSICNKNPLRYLGNDEISMPNIVTGFDSSGRFLDSVVNGVTQNTWTLSPIAEQPLPSTDDNAGATLGNYNARCLLTFDLGSFGLTAEASKLKKATLRLFPNLSSITSDNLPINVDFYRIHSFGETADHPGITNDYPVNARDFVGGEQDFDQRCTWCEYHYTGNIAIPTIESFPFDDSPVPFSDPGDVTNEWQNTFGSTGISWGMGNTAGISADVADPYEAYSGGATGTNTSEVDSSFTGFTIDAVPLSDYYEINLLNAAKDSITHYTGKLRILVRLRDDMNLTSTQWVSFHSHKSPFPDRRPRLFIQYQDN